MDISKRPVSHLLNLKNMLAPIENDVAEIAHFAHSLLMAKRAGAPVSSEKEQEMLENILAAAKRIAH